MGSGDWFKTILSLKKGKDNQSKSEKVCSTDTAKSNGLRRKHHSSSKIRNGAVQDRYLGLSVEDIAAIRIQTVFRSHVAEWSGSSDTIEESFARIHQREEASLKRERALAYAFTHQLFAYDFSKASEWGRSWKERWIAARPWEARVPSRSSMPVSKQSTDASKKINSSTTKVHVKHKTPSNKQEPASSSEPEKLKRPISRNWFWKMLKRKK